MSTPAPSSTIGGDARSGLWRRLAYRWFVEYNPLYLLSAALVLAGCFLLSCGIAREENPLASLGIALTSEVYALSLLGGAALLTRIGQRRPAVLLALLFLLYQWDLTLHTETCAYLGRAGTYAAVAWVAIFTGKMYAIAWALRVRLSGRLVIAALVGAVGLAVGPRVISDLGGRNAGALLGTWAFALGALSRPSGGITSKDELTPWGHAVLVRATRAAWILSGVLLFAHVLFWATQHSLEVSSVLPVVPLVFVRQVRSEARTWATVTGTLAIVAVGSPGTFFVAALLAAVALALRAFSPTFSATPGASPPAAVPARPYRSSEAQPDEVESARPEATAPLVGPAECARSFVGSLFTLYLSAWTLGWSGGPWPAHIAALDVALTIAVLLAVWKLHARVALAPLAASYVHLVVQARLVPMPQSQVEWGMATIALGFVLLGGSLATSYVLRASPPSGGRGAGRWPAARSGPGEGGSGPS